jgi:hypothetical protein
MENDKWKMILKLEHHTTEVGVYESIGIHG